MCMSERHADSRKLVINSIRMTVSDDVSEVETNVPDGTENGNGI